jgi:hypothetical protein
MPISMLDGWRKDDPPMTKTPVEADVPEYLCHIGMGSSATPLEVTVGDLTLIAVYYLLQVGEYMCKSSRNNTKQTVQFRVKGVTFFRYCNGSLYQLLWNAPDGMILSAHSATLKLDNQKIGWKGMCIH